VAGENINLNDGMMPKRAIRTNLCRKVYICQLDMQSVLW